MNIFFTYKKRGSQDNEDRCLEIIEYLKKYGTITSAYIRERNIDYSGAKLTDKEILERNSKMIREADILVAEVTTPSLGVGYQIHFSKTINKRIVCLYKNQIKTELSPIINGDEGLEIIKYDTLKELFSKLDIIFNK